ncbi:hypothetical protein OG215_41880 (plasmid) [Streptomyces globisporus]|uniref:hypothetical protein n=1 Tax=Streptomyces globisporus TaxID=1908 RepID=UPI002F912225|nr:hypothetical protein OG215_41880 [Streptomyces globisporus]
MSRLPHPSLLPALPAPTNRASARRPLDLRVHAQRIQIDELIVTDPRTVLAHARTATPLTLPAAAALLCSLHGPDDLAEMGIRLVRHVTRTTAATQHRDPVVLELSDDPEDTGR